MSNIFSESFHNEGYVIARNIIGLEIIDEALRQLFYMYGGSHEDTNSQDNKSTNQLFQDAFNAYRQQEKKSSILKSRRYDFSSNLPVTSLFHCSISPYIDILFGSKFIFTKGQYRFDDCEGSRSLNLHQEIFGMLSNSTITAWIPLCDTNESLGGLSIIPNSHLHGVLPHKFMQSYSGFSSHGVDLGSEKIPRLESAITLQTNVGDAIFFNPLLVHGTSMPTNSIADRITFVCRSDKIGDMQYLANESASRKYLEQT